MSEAISVSKLNIYIKQIFDAEELLHNISVVGEVFGVSLSRNVIYFSLKDEGATLPCVCFFSNFIDVIKEGDCIIVTGSPNFYVKGGKLNFNVTRVEKAGQGKLYEQFLLMKEKLEKEGLFDPSHKKPLPKTINRIGVITSSEGAVIQDIKNVSWRRNPALDIVLFNTKVQGFQAEKEIAHAIEVLGNYDKIDVIVVARGGGSLEDLWAYNTEIVARATYNCPKPIVSAVGHETDFTIIDFVSDLRAATPSVAGELLTFDKGTKKDELAQLSQRFILACSNLLNNKATHISYLGKNLENIIDKTLSQTNHELVVKNRMLMSAFEAAINLKYYELGLIDNTLSKINPNSILQKGYAKIEQNDKPISAKAFLNQEQNINVIFKDGSVNAKILKGE